MGKIAIITGTRKGIGKEIADYYLQQQFLVFGCSRGESSIEHPGYKHYCLDVADEKAVVFMVQDLAKQYGKIDILINNAGIASMNHIALTPYNTVTKILATNFIGTFIFVREVGKIMIKNKWGRIVNFSTVATPLRLEGEAVYAASKAAVANFTEIAAREFAGYNITVNCIGPTPIATDLIKNVPPDKIGALLSRQAINRFGEFKDIINVIDFFISEKSDFVTGQTIYLGGINV